MTSWNISDSKLPRADRAMAVGAYNGTIFLIGGWDNQRQVMEYKTETKTLIDLGVDVLSRTTYGTGQYWSQIDHMIYTIDSFDHLNVFNMITKEFTANWNDITFNIKIEYFSCLASTSEYLLITGGYLSNALQILSLTTHQWLHDAPPMNRGRASHSCIVHYNYLWTFGGLSIDSIERISLINITQNVWHFTDPLSKGLSGSTAVSWYHTIFVIGGYDDHLYDIVHLVDANTGNVTVSPYSLPYHVINGAPIIVDQRLYIFGGCCISATLPQFELKEILTTDWVYYQLFAYSSTTVHSPHYTTETATIESYSSTLKYGDAAVIEETETTNVHDINDISPPSLSISTPIAVIITIVSTVIVVAICYTLWKMVHRRILKKHSEKDVNNAMNEIEDKTKSVQNDDEKKDDAQQKVDDEIKDNDEDSHESLFEPGLVITPQTDATAVVVITEQCDGDNTTATSTKDDEIQKNHNNTVFTVTKPGEPMNAHVEGARDESFELDDIYVKGEEDSNESHKVHRNYIVDTEGEQLNDIVDTEGELVMSSTKTVGNMFYDKYRDSMHKEEMNKHEK